MINPKKRYVFFLLLLMQSPHSLSAEQQTPPSTPATDKGYIENEQGDIEFFDIENMGDLPDDDFDAGKTRGISDVAQTFLTDPGIAAFVVENLPEGGLWNIIRRPRGRDPLYFGFPFYDWNRSLPFTYFYNKTDRLPITTGKVFNLNFSSSAEQTFLSFLGGFYGADSATEIFSLVPFIARMSVEERKTGLRLYPQFTRGALVLRADTTLFLSERNLITNPEDEARIRQIVTNNFGRNALSSFEEEREAARILVGIGDTRLRLGLTMVDQQRAKVQFGLSSYIPSANGVMLDGKFKKPKRSEFSLFGLGDTFEDIRSIFLQPELGNYGHFGLGFYFDSSFKFFKERLEAKTAAIYETFFNSDEQRLIMKRQTISPQQYVKDSANLAGDFFDQYFLPRKYTVSVRPGNIFHLINYGKLSVGKVKFGLGYDYYLQQREEFQKIKNPEEDPTSLAIYNAASPEGIAHKALFGMHYGFRWGKTPIDLGLGGDYTFATNKHLGKDWTAHGSIGFKI
jgi:hypothetical protein